MAPKHRLYTPEIAEEILERLEDGEGLSAICALEGMPSQGAVRHWVQTDHDGFAARYARARERGLEKHADEIIEIADTARDSDSASAARVRVDARKWILSKLLPKQYGDKINLEHSGEVAMTDVPDDQLDKRLKALMAQAGGGDQS
ncbi:terminase small subunit [Komagataeibacter sp. FNDCR2]|uniref:terminase small subunit-like protein n=1 Tax=Komagataeibacter sp. FNDCR2 TaxID=2878682 RepID=UPI001E35A543|nr:terminase small subunit [Komagataeibacter sp. FNDCR2]MCE2574830.1 terminase small subunit [Komagataeibacter sp. FNDCR2]